MRYVLFFLLICSLTACKKIDRSHVTSDRSLVDIKEINAQLRGQWQLTGRAEWTNWESNFLWSAIAQSDSIVAVGYQPVGFRMGPETLGSFIWQDPSWQMARKQVLALGSSAGRAAVEIWPERSLPVVVIRLHSVEDLIRLRGSPYVRYVEPMGYERQLNLSDQQAESSSGCGSNSPNYDIRSGLHYSSLPPAVKQSWNYPGHGIPQAWTRCSGKGVKVFLIDTGCSWAQENMGALFNSGASYGRSLEKMVTLPRNNLSGIPVGPLETSNDMCGHGTSMAGAIAAPRSSDGNAVGIAYNCDLITCRAAADVLLDESRELKGVVDAFTYAADRADVRIISMSLGRVTSSSYLADAIRYAYGRGKLIFSAAGTSMGWTAGWAGVIFPASLPEVQAVTGVKDLAALQACEVCHKGPEVDFVVTMEKVSDGMHPLSLADAGDWPSTVGGSSVATASMAGMTALLWSRFPRLTRDQMIMKLQQSCSQYPYRSLSFGWGRLNLELATR